VVTISPQQLVLKERTPKVEVEEETDWWGMVNVPPGQRYALSSWWLVSWSSFWALCFTRWIACLST
jgi:hypothetical protein